MIDEVAERARSLDGWAFGTLAEFSQHARLKEEPGKYPPAQEMIAALLADHEVVIRRLRIDIEACAEKYHDTGTNDFLTGLMEKHEKMAWMCGPFWRQIPFDSCLRISRRARRLASHYVTVLPDALACSISRTSALG